MKIILLFTILLAAETSLASEGQNNFHLLNSNCAEKTSEAVETSPQSPPLDVDDPGTPGCNKWEVNVLIGGDISKNETNWQLPLLDINYGIGSNLQLKFELPFLNDHSEESSVVGVGTSKAGIKANFYQNEESELEMAIYPQVEFTTPNSNINSGTIVTLPLLVSKKVGETSKGDVMVTANLGYNISSQLDTTDFVSASLGVGLPLSRRIALMTELSTEQAVSKKQRRYP